MPRRPSAACPPLFSSWFPPARMESPRRTWKRRRTGTSSRGGRGDRRYRGTAKGTRLPALLPGRGADDTAEEGPPGCPCDSSQSERLMRTPSRPPRSCRGCKTTLPRDTLRCRAPQAPTPTIFWPFLHRYAFFVAVPPALAEPKAVAATTPSRPCRRGPWVLCVSPQLLAALEARQYALVFAVAAQHGARWQLACIASRLPRRLSRRVSQWGKCMYIFGPFPPSVQLSRRPSWSLSAHGGPPPACLCILTLWWLVPLQHFPQHNSRCRCCAGTSVSQDEPFATTRLSTTSPDRVRRVSLISTRVCCNFFAYRLYPATS